MSIGDLSVDQVLEHFANEVGLGAAFVIRDRRDGERHLRRNRYTEVDHFAAHGSTSGKVCRGVEVSGKRLDMTNAGVFPSAVADFAQRPARDLGFPRDLRPCSFARLKFGYDEIIEGCIHDPGV